MSTKPVSLPEGLVARATAAARSRNIAVEKLAEEAVEAYLLEKPPPEPWSALEIYTHVRGELTYEANLIAQRTAWFIASQAFLFSALAVGVDRSAAEASLSDSLFFPMIPILSLIVCGSILVSVTAALFSVKTIRTSINTLIDANPTISSAFPKRSKWVIRAGLTPSVLLPLSFGTAWVIVLGWA